MTTAPAAPTPVATDRLRTVLILLCVSIPSFMINLDSTIVAVSLPSIARSLKTAFAGIAWVISADTLPVASPVMPFDALAAVVAGLNWWLVRSADTPPLSRHAPSAVVLPVD